MTARNICAILIDLSGTLHIENTVIPGAVEALNRLRTTSLRVKFVTNTSKENKETLHIRLRELGFNIQKDEIFTSLTAARNLVKDLKLRPKLLLRQDAIKDFEGISTENPDSVVVGLAPDCFNYETLNTAFKILMDGGTFIAINKARYFQRGDGLALGPGPFVDGLEFATGKQATVVGKPTKAFFLEALKSLECVPGEAIMIGDDVRDDIHGAQVLGMKGILVKTGKYRDGDERRIEPAPMLTSNNFAEAVDYIINQLMQQNSPI